MRTGLRVPAAELRILLACAVLGLAANAAFPHQAEAADAAVAKSTTPTVAETILSAMDRDLAAHDAAKRDDLHDYERRRIEDRYLIPLAKLGDKRIAAELAKRAKASDSVRMRRKYALAACQLGAPEPVTQFSRDFKAGTLTLPAEHRANTAEEDQPNVVELNGMIQCLARAGKPECDQALNALARPDHPFHALAAKWIEKPLVGLTDESAWCSHPFCIAILQANLNDVNPTGGTYRIEANMAVLTWPTGGGHSRSLSDFLTDPAARRAEASERACDAAATKIEDLVFGLPPYHPLLVDADWRIEEPQGGA